MMLKWLNYDKIPSRKEELKSKTLKYLDHIDDLKKPQPQKVKDQAGGGDKKAEEEKDSLHDAIKACIVKTIPNISFKDVAGLDKAK